VEATESLYLRDAYQRVFDARVVAVDADGARVALDRSAFYPTGGGQPNDTGTLAGAQVVDVRKGDGLVWHTLVGPLPAVGDRVEGEIDWHRRHALMRTHSSLHVLGGVVWNEWRVAATGNNMTPLAARIDYEFDPLPDGFAARLEQLINLEIAADRPIVVSFLPRGAADVDPELIRTKANLIPESVTEVRVVDIVGLDKQADGGTHVRSTGEIGRVAVTKTESKGKGNKRIRIEVRDA
jgi:misacylated tRNA(Ala) deacylase